MAEPVIWSDPHAWLRPYYAALKRDPSFSQLEPARRLEALAAAIERDYPAQAAEVREWNAVTGTAMLDWFDDVTAAKPAVRETELWRVARGHHVLRCVAVYLPAGIDLRLLEEGAVRQTELFGDAPTLHGRSRQWRRSLARAGWSDEGSVQPVQAE